MSSTLNLQKVVTIVLKFNIGKLIPPTTFTNRAKGFCLTSCIKITNKNPNNQTFIICKSGFVIN